MVFSVHRANPFKYFWVITKDAFLSVERYDGATSSTFLTEFNLPHVCRPSIRVEDTVTTKIVLFQTDH